MGLKRDRKFEGKSAQPELRLVKIQCEKIYRNCASRDNCGYFYDKNRQSEDNKVLPDSTRGIGYWELADVSEQWLLKHRVI